MYLGSYRTTFSKHFKDEACFFMMYSHYYDQSFHLQRSNDTCQGLLSLSLCNYQSRGGQFREPVLAVRAGRAAPTAPLPSLAMLGEPLCTSIYMGTIVSYSLSPLCRETGLISAGKVHSHLDRRER